jgi:predicted DCC family thiol-disulfide oxidoreductase YuxK
LERKKVVNPKANIIFFDGVCNLCNGFISFLFFLGLPTDLKVASLQGNCAKKYLPEEERQNLSSVIYLRNEKTYKESTAVITIMMDITWYYRPLGLLLVIPSFLRDSIYRFIAKNRYRFFGKKSTCRLPLESERQYFLD